MNATAQKTRRPVSVTLVVGLAGAFAIYSLVNAGLAIESGEEDRVLDAVFNAVRGVGLLVVSLRPFWLRGWGWAGFMTWGGCGLTH